MYRSNNSRSKSNRSRSKSNLSRRSSQAQMQPVRDSNRGIQRSLKSISLDDVNRRHIVSQPQQNEINERMTTSINFEPYLAPNNHVTTFSPKFDKGQQDLITSRYVMTTERHLASGLQDQDDSSKRDQKHTNESITLSSRI